MVMSEGKRAFVILIVCIIAAMLAVGAIHYYIPAMRPYVIFLYLIVIFGGGIGVFLVVNIWSGNRIKRAKKY